MMMLFLNLEISRESTKYFAF